MKNKYTIINALLLIIILVVIYININNSLICSNFRNNDLTERYTTITCPANKYLSKSECAPCPIGSISNQGSVSINDCVCTNPALLLDPVKQECRPCSAGTYISPSGDQCIKCPIGTSSNEGSMTIQDCKCPAGSESINGRCYQCKKGYYKNDIGNHACVLCPYNSYVKYEGAIDVSECKCLARSYYDMSTMTCKPCPSLTSSLDNWTECKACSLNNTLNGQTCSCPAGKYLTSDGFCIDCPPNYYSNTFNTTVCTPCPAGKGSKSGQSCTLCPANSTSTLSNSINGLINSGCLCSKGFYMDNGQCVICPAGKTTLVEGAVSVYDCI